MFTFPQIDPVAFTIGPISIHWYGITYVVAFGSAWFLAGYRAKKHGGVWSSEQISDLVFYAALGAVIGGRLGSVFFYSFDRFLDDPLYLFKTWQGGMSFHGGFLGVMTAIYIYSRSIKKNYIDVLDFIAPLAPFGLGAGRFGNFINGELWGRPTEATWGMVFPHVDQLPRHPSQLYEFFLEGVVLFALLWWYSSKPRPRFAQAGLFSVGYGSFRFFVEFFRQPDSDIGFIAFEWLTMGQLLSLPMIIAGLLFLYLASQQPSQQQQASNQQ